MLEPRSPEPSHLGALSIIERVCSVLSLLGSSFVIVTFIMSKRFHKPINRLVFYASFGNMMSNVGTLMSRTFIHHPQSAGCQAQGFLIQWFLPADALWTLAMAINVYLTFYFRFDARRLRRMEIPYLFICYGVPFVPALTYLFITNEDGVKVYGDAKLWCWVSRQWGIWRIITFYGPVWLVVVLTFFIYIRAGHTIYRKRKELGGFQSTDQELTTRSEAYATVKTTQVSVTFEAGKTNEGVDMKSPGRPGQANAAGYQGTGNYSVHISANRGSDHRDDAINSAQDQQQSDRSSRVMGAYGDSAEMNEMRKRYHDINHAAWQYTKCAILFFTAMLITWIPSSANRVFSLARGGDSSVTLEYMSALVLPLQGFWNALIYMVTTWTATKNIIHDFKMGRRPDVKEFVGGMAPAIQNSPIHHSLHRHSQAPYRTGMRSNKACETESMTELAENRAES